MPPLPIHLRPPCNPPPAAQAAPLLPNGTTWNDPLKSTAEFPQGPLGEGMYLPQDAMQPGQPLGESGAA